MDIKINEVSLSVFCKVMDFRKDILPPREWSTMQIPSRAGAYLFNKKINARIFEIDIKFIGEVETQRRGLAAILESDDVIPLEFGDRPGILYYGVVVDETEIKRLWHTGDATIRFLVPDPYGVGPEYSAVIGAGNETGTVNINGDADVFPVVRATFQANSAFYGLSNDEEDFLFVGSSPTVEETVLPYEERVFWDEFDTTTGWTSWGGVPDAGTVTGTMVSTGTRFEASSIGTGTEWHGPALVKALSVPLQDFLVEFTATQGSSLIKSVGRVELYLLDANSRTVAKLIIRDSDPNAYMNYGFARLGAGSDIRYLIDRKTSALNGFIRGRLRLRRDGQKFTAQLAKVDSNGKIVYSIGGDYFDVSNEYQAPITQVVVAIAGYGTNPLSNSGADDLKLFKLNKPSSPSVIDRMFMAGDVLEIDGRTGLVTKNGINIIGRLNPQSKFFRLKPGANVLGIASGGAVSTEVTYKSRWL